MRFNIKRLDYLFVLRPVLFFPIWTVFLAGYYCAIRFSRSRSDLEGSAIWVLFLYTLLMGSVFIINQIADIKSDKRNGKLFLIANGHISKRAAYLEASLLALISLSISFLFYPRLGFLFLIAFLITGVFYSLRPFCWKDRPYLGLLVNVLGGYLTFSVGWFTVADLGVGSSLHSFPYLLAIIAVYYYTTLPDIKGDRDSGKITFGVKYGFKKTIYFALAAEILAIIFSIITRDPVMFFPAMVALPFFIWTTRTQTLKEVVRTTRLSILFLSLAVCVKFPLYFPLLLFVAMISRWYYRHRFGLEYPSLVAG